VQLRVGEGSSYKVSVLVSKEYGYNFLAKGTKALQHWNLQTPNFAEWNPDLRCVSGIPLGIS